MRSAYNPKDGSLKNNSERPVVALAVKKRWITDLLTTWNQEMLAHLTRDASASKNYNTIQYNNNCYSSGVALWYIKQINKNLQSTLNSFHNNLTKTFKTAPRCLWCWAPASNVVHILCSKFALIMTSQNSASLYMMLASTLLYFFAPLAVVVFLYTRWLFLWSLVVVIVRWYIM